MKLLQCLYGLRSAGRDRWMARCPAHQDHTPSLSIRWVGDRFLLHCFAGCPVEVILKTLGLGWNDLHQRELPGGFALKTPDLGTSDPRAQARIEHLWNRAHPLTGEDEASRYLRFRGLPPSQTSPSLRFVEALEYHHQGRYIGVFPALIAKVVHPWWGRVALHRTYLRQGGLGKAPVPAPKKLTRPIFAGATKGAATRLGMAGSRLAVAEGLETALAVQAMTSWATWAAVSAGGMAVLEVPDSVREVLIAADHDPVNPTTGLRPGEAAARALASRLVQQGIRVHLAIPPDESTDWLDGYLVGTDLWGHSELWVRRASGSNQPRLAGHKPYLGHPATAFHSSPPAL